MLSLLIPTMLAGAIQYSPAFMDTAGWYFPSPHSVKTVETKEAPSRIDVNEAGSEQLQRLPGIGPKKAGLIIQARTRRPFRRATDLLRIKGIGRKTLKKMAPLLEFRKRSRGSEKR